MLNWQQEMSNIAATATNIADPIERLHFLETARQEIGDRLTTLYEKACWDARLLDLDDVAIATTSLSKTAFTNYSRRYNDRLSFTERVRWADPFRGHRLQRIDNLSDVGLGNTPYAVPLPPKVPVPSEQNPDPVEQGDGDVTGG